VIVRARLGGVLCLSAAVVAGVAAGSALASAQVSLDRLVGQTVMSAISGTTPSASLLARVRRGEIGGIILFGANVVTKPQVRALVSRLQQAAKAGGNPPLLIATDQEGGGVRRFHSGPPFDSAAAMGKTGTAAGFRDVGRATADFLRPLGVDVDLAPVLDVPNSPANFLRNRAFSSRTSVVARLGPAFAAGVQQGHVAATAKHFPGLGTAPANTDLARVVIRTPRDELLARLAPYRPAIRNGVRLVMVSNASYPALDRSGLPAVLSSAIVGGLLRAQFGFHGVVITDALEAPGPARYADAPIRALKAGVDVLLFTDETSSADGFGLLLQAARHGALSRSTLLKANERILALKTWLEQ
jgi:beta-N-acetylhexosaminidase